MHLLSLKGIGLYNSFSSAYGKVVLQINVGKSVEAKLRKTQNVFLF